jgi:hypothetical protein
MPISLREILNWFEILVISMFDVELFDSKESFYLLLLLQEIVSASNVDGWSIRQSLIPLEYIMLMVVFF